MTQPLLCARLPPGRRIQKGYLLPQLAIVVMVGSLLTAYAGNRYWQATLDQGRDDKAKMVGERMANVSDAVKTYATTFFTQIQQGQTITRNGYTLPPQRILNPTAADLNALGFLPATAINPVIYNGQSIQYNVIMQVNTQSGCSIPTCSLVFRVITSAPLRLPDSTTPDTRRATLAANSASPGNAGVSLPAAMGGDPNVFVASGGTVIGSNPTGVAGLVAMTNGYDSQGFFEFLRRDGSLPMTGTLNLQDASGTKHDIANANDIDAVNVTASSAVNGETVTSTGRLKSGEFLQLDGVAVEGGTCQPRTMALDSGGLALTCQSGRWARLRTYRFDRTTVAAVNRECIVNDPTSPPLYDTFTYQVTCAVRYCTRVYGYQFGLINEYRIGYNKEHPYYSQPNTVLDIACSR
ncbi:shufflon system plasmid conjugative transfer pilus tip adhesin PilV [Pseudomonas ovata]|uniref:shufflon system plasmid conjugative transfer pilus tip adhesin PilV n=1 Tax=Pseudomonas ovata TaxID=1839709 RepID=UPI000D69A0D9|nr:shufflon system plasmid conjugative transfer pilus tip adhesin PilV [Pseudomonas ovata]